jgi:hypothetical protein
VPARTDGPALLEVGRCRGRRLSEAGACASGARPSAGTSRHDGYWRANIVAANGRRLQDTEPISVRSCSLRAR